MCINPKLKYRLNEYRNNLNCCDIHFTYMLLHMANLLNPKLMLFFVNRIDHFDTKSHYFSSYKFLLDYKYMFQ